MVAEQFAGQQLLALKKIYEELELFYWHGEAKGSSAEIDYLWQKVESVIPIEIKAGKTGTLKSLRLFLREKMYLLVYDFPCIHSPSTIQYFPFPFMP